MKKIVVITLLLFFALFLALGGYRFLGVGLSRLTTKLEVLPTDARIHYEANAQALAQEIGHLLTASIATIEKKQYGKFSAPVNVYIFATEKSFAHFSGSSKTTKASSFRNEVYLSGALLQESSAVQRALLQELSHIQLLQSLGYIQLNRTLPLWFQEGLAMYAANDGMKNIDLEKQAKEKMLSGVHFLPTMQGRLFSRRFPTTGSLDSQLLKVQSGMYVRFLAQTHPGQFGYIMKNIQKGLVFRNLFFQAFRKHAGDKLWNFMQTLKAQ